MFNVRRSRFDKMGREIALNSEFRRIDVKEGLRCSRTLDGFFSSIRDVWHFLPRSSTTEVAFPTRSAIYKNIRKEKRHKQGLPLFKVRQFRCAKFKWSFEVPIVPRRTGRVRHKLDEVEITEKFRGRSQVLSNLTLASVWKWRLSIRR